MPDAVGPNDAQRGRSTIFGIGLPGTKPIRVRDLDDVHIASWGGFRKPKQVDDRVTPSRKDLSGGGYTPAQSSTDLPKFLLVFLGGPIALLAVIGFIGWLSSGSPEPVTSVCDETGYSAFYDGADFHPDVRRVHFSVNFETLDGPNVWREGSVFRSPNPVRLNVEIPARTDRPILSCTVERIWVE